MRFVSELDRDHLAIESGALMAAEHVAMLLGMLVVMLLRPAEYAHGHVRREAVPA